MTPDERRERAKTGAGVRWAKPGARERQAAAARAAMRARLAEQVDPDGLMSPDELDAAVASAAKAQGARLRLAKLRRSA